MNEKRCMGCMRIIEQGEKVCPKCGHRHEEYVQPEFALPTGSMLHAGKYVVGKMLGQGGFGITYLGLDQSLEMKVAIKEYYPQALAFRTEGSQKLSWHTSVTNQEIGRDSFVKEARKMAKIVQIPSIVQVRDIFFENETAYIIMNYIEGETLKGYLDRTGPMNERACVKLLAPIIQSLSKAHKEGLIHRDISPDNIMIDLHGSIWLLDLGAAKELDPGQLTRNLTQSTNLVVRHGFSPLEQYTDSGNIGAWTDVYAICATIYYCLTGKVPPFAIDRVYKPELAFPASISPAMARVLDAGLALRAEDRIQDAETLLAALESPETFTGAAKSGGGKKTEKTAGGKEHETDGGPGMTGPSGGAEKRKLPKWTIPAVSAAAVAIIAGVIALNGQGKVEAPIVDNDVYQQTMAEESVGRKLNESDGASETTAESNAASQDEQPTEETNADEPQEPDADTAAEEAAQAAEEEAARQKAEEEAAAAKKAEEEAAAKKAEEEAAKKKAEEEAAKKKAEEEAAKKKAEEEAAKKKAEEEAAAKKAAEEEAARKKAEEEAAAAAAAAAAVTKVTNEPFTFVTSKFTVKGVYTGEWKDGKPNGEGTMTMRETNDRWNYGDTLWSANWVNGLIEGYGQWRSAVDGAYDGNFVHGLKSGRGKMWFSDGTVYDGQWSGGDFLG